MEKHPWTDCHFIIQAKGCVNRKVDSSGLKQRPWLKGTCHVCVNYLPQKHTHNDFPMGSELIHASCINHKMEAKN